MAILEVQKNIKFLKSTRGLKLKFNKNISQKKLKQYC